MSRTCAESKWVVMETISTLLQAAPSVGFTWGVLGGTSGIPRLPGPRDKSHRLSVHARTREEFLLAVVLCVEMGNKQLAPSFKNNNSELCRSLGFPGTQCSGIRCASPCAGSGARMPGTSGTGAASA